MKTRNIKTEIWKAIHNKMFVLSLLVGISLALTDVAQNYSTVKDMTQSTLEMLENGLGSGGHTGFSLFVLWMPINGVNLGSLIFYLIWPVLAAIPYGWSYCREKHIGVSNQITARIGKESYYNAKYIAVFVSGGLAVMLPVVVNLLANAMICPYEIPELMLTPISNGYFLSALYYTNPCLYALVWCGMEFLFGGAAGCLCFIVGSRLRYQVMTTLVPFALLMLFDVVSTRLFVGLPITISPLQMAKAATAEFSPGWVLFAALIIMIGANYGIGYLEVVKREAI